MRKYSEYQVQMWEPGLPTPAGRVRNSLMGDDEEHGWGEAGRGKGGSSHEPYEEEANASSVPDESSYELSSRIAPRRHRSQLRYNKLLATASRVSIKHYESIQVVA